MLDTWLSLGGVEIGNNTRVASYLIDSGAGQILQGTKCLCPTLPDAFDEPPYVSPELDPAPWYDDADPRSERFAGLWIEKIEGLLDSPVEREVTQRATDGAVRACARYSDRTLTVTGWLVAKDTCGADYGKAWLQAALLGTECSGCGGDDLCILACCPTYLCDDGGEGEGEGEADGEGEDDLPGGEDTGCWDTNIQLRTLKNAALVSGPDVVRQAPGYQEGTCVEGFRLVYQVTFQLSVEPYLWRQPIQVLDRHPWPDPADEDQVCHITWNDNADCDPDNPDCVPGSNVPLDGCEPDEHCPSNPPPPRVPAATATCVCLPLTAVRLCFDIPDTLVPSTLDAGLRLEVYAGDSPLRNLAIRIWRNPLGRSTDELDGCHTTGVYYITYVPAGGTIVVDGASESATMYCRGGVVRDADEYVYGPAAGPLNHITLTRGATHTVCADVDAEYVDPLANLSVYLLPREV